MSEPRLRVGLVQGRPRLRLRLQGRHELVSWSDTSIVLEPGDYEAATASRGLVKLRSVQHPGVSLDGVALRIVPMVPEQASLLLREVTVGVDFHWQHEEDLVFRGTLCLERRAGGLDAVNEIALEDYLVSVISSEMSARCPLALLRAHAIISRSWLLAQQEGRAGPGAQPAAAAAPVERDGALHIRRWYDREDHVHFDVCGDDHCQRYQGITRAFTPQATEAVRHTQGLVLLHDGTVCDARFSKCCGGFTELFSSAWGDEDPAYLQAFADLPASREPGYSLPLSDEEHARRFIAGEPQAFCQGVPADLLGQLLPELDHDTADFYRWEQVLEQQELQGLLQSKLGLDTGAVRALTPLARGPSGRLIALGIEAERVRLVLGKELEIRRALSPSHLYSSAFIVRPEGEVAGVPERFRLRGAGWGHGVGLCQIGAAVMAERGYDHRAILAHYYRGAKLQRRY